MLPTEPRLPEVRPLIEKELYFVLHAPRQSGKTTCFQALARALTAEGKYAAVHASCERGNVAGSDVERGVQAVLRSIEYQTRRLPEALRPEPLDDFRHMEAESRLHAWITHWCERSERPVVLFLDEIDSLWDDTLVSVLRQLRDGYPDRPNHFPLSVALVGMRDVRDYRSLTLEGFTEVELANLYRQHSEETGQIFTDAAVQRAYDLTRGQPWLINALARQVVEKLVPNRATCIEASHVDRAAATLIARRDTHLDSLIERLREARVERVISPILEGELVLGDGLHDDISYVKDLGLVTARDGHLEIANPIYHEVIPRALAAMTQETIPNRTEWYVGEKGLLDMDALLEGFVEFWFEHGEAMMQSQPYREVAFQLVVMSFLQRITNGDGWIDREYAIGRGRMDLCIHWPHPGGVQREVLELKVWRDRQSDPLRRGLDQVGRYLDSLGLDHGALLIFDRRQAAGSLRERGETSEVEHGGRHIRLLRL